MNLVDYTFDLYGRLLETALEAGWEITTVRGYLQADDPPEPVMVVRHDVDRRVRNAPRMAALEADLGVTSTYYFRKKTFSRAVVEDIEDQGHEIGYHYEDLARAKGDLELAYRQFEENLEAFREVVDIDTIAAHGSALSPQRNLDMWTDGRSFEEYGLLGEAYVSLGIHPPAPGGMDYVSDTNRTWRTAPYDLDVDTTSDLIESVRRRESNRLCVLAHPNRWAINRLQLVERAGWDLCAESVKTVVDRLYSDTSSDPAR